jgi:hypothetical protein
MIARLKRWWRRWRDPATANAYPVTIDMGAVISQLDDDPAPLTALLAQMPVTNSRMEWLEDELRPREPDEIGPGIYFRAGDVLRTVDGEPIKVTTIRHEGLYYPRTFEADDHPTPEGSRLELIVFDLNHELEGIVATLKEMNR